MSKFLTINEQLNKLENANLKIEYRKIAKKQLFYHGYYGVIKENRLPFINRNITDCVQYQDNVSFEDIFNVYEMDVELRSVMMNACIQFESAFKQELIRSWCNHYGTEQSAYLNKQNYRSPRNNQEKLDNLISTFNYYAMYETSNPFVSYRENVGNIPPWILAKQLYLGQAIKWYTLLKSPLKNEIIANLLPGDLIHDIGMNSTKEIFGQFLSLIREFRNRSAHGGQIYLFAPKRKNGKPIIKFNQTFHDHFNIDQRLYDKGYGQTGIWTLNKFFSILKFKEPYNDLNQFLKNQYKLIMVSIPAVNEYVNSSPLVSNIDEEKFIQFDLFK